MKIVLVFPGRAQKAIVGGIASRRVALHLAAGGAVAVQRLAAHRLAAHFAIITHVNRKACSVFSRCCLPPAAHPGASLCPFPWFQPDSLFFFLFLQQQKTFRAQSVAFQHCVALLPFAYNLLLLVCYKPLRVVGGGGCLRLALCLRHIKYLCTNEERRNVERRRRRTSTTMASGINYNNFFAKNLKPEHVGGVAVVVNQPPASALVNKIIQRMKSLLLLSVGKGEGKGKGKVTRVENRESIFCSKTSRVGTHFICVRVYYVIYICLQSLFHHRIFC